MNATYIDVEVEVLNFLSGPMTRCDIRACWLADGRRTRGVEMEVVVDGLLSRLRASVI